MQGSIADAERLRRLQLITDAALAHLDVDELLEALLVRIREALDVDTVAVLLLDEAAQELVARAALGIEEEVEQGVRIPLGRGFAGRVCAERRPILLPDVDHADVLNPILRQKGIKTLLGVPLLVHGEPIGVLHVGSLTPREFRRDDVELLQLVGDRAALAIEHARVFRMEQRARQRLENLQSVTDAALTHLEFDELLPELLPRIRDVLAVDTVAVLLVDETEQELVARAALGIEEEVEQGVRIPIGGGFAGRVCAERRPVILSRVDRDHVLNPILIEKGIRALLGVPLLVRGEPIGVLHVGSLVPRAFTQDDVELLQLVADRTALAIEKARLHDESVRLDQLKLNFVAVASHELRTPATAVYGIIATLREHTAALPPETRAELQETLWQQAVRLRRLIEQLLDLSRLDASAIHVAPQPLVLESVVRDVVRLVQTEPGAPPVDVSIDRDLALVSDPVALERVLGNVLGNAVRYGEPPYRVAADPLDRYVRVRVEDHGPGIPPELAPRLFERFERGGEGGGSGLGLAIAKAYALALGGDLIHVPREEGTRFDLVLPRQ